MHALSFTLSREGVVRIHDAVLCLAKFSEVVSFEACADRVRISIHMIRDNVVTIYTAYPDRFELF